ncbi:hypothetical protein C8Q80DRAFT_684474 [Daedaleopsis nitida]|nr:hypothetical protein C8Q80DRAFT_684474 [Daedaleopsis nitida]
MSDPSSVYAPRPQPASSSSAYLHPHGSDPRDAASRSLTASPNSSVYDAYKQDGHGTGVEYREVTRTPSPTPSEVDILSRKAGSHNFKKYLDPNFWKNRKNVVSFVVTVVIVGVLIAFLVLQDQIVDAIAPAATWLRETPFAWLIPIAIMIVLSFPPLFGHEVIHILCGEVWGPWIGFGIVAAGTLVGELITYYTFRLCCRGRAEKNASKNLTFALYAEIIQEGGLKMAIMFRYSAIPGHFVTAIFASTGMGVVTFLIAAVVSLPVQFANVFLGTGHSIDENGNRVENPSKTTKILKIVIITFTVLVTIIAMRYVNAQIDRVKQSVVYERRKRRQAKLAGLPSTASGFRSADARTLVDPEDVDSAPLVPKRARGSAEYIPLHTAGPAAPRSTTRAKFLLSWVRDSKDGMTTRITEEKLIWLRCGRRSLNINMGRGVSRIGIRTTRTCWLCRTIQNIDYVAYIARPSHISFPLMTYRYIGLGISCRKRKLRTEFTKKTAPMRRFSNYSQSSPGSHSEFESSASGRMSRILRMYTLPSFAPEARTLPSADMSTCVTAA